MYFIAFIDPEKAFDNVGIGSMWQVLEFPLSKEKDLAGIDNFNEQNSVCGLVVGKVNFYS